MTPEEKAMNGSDVPVGPATVEAQKPDAFATGRERMAQIGEKIAAAKEVALAARDHVGAAISGAKEKVSGWASSIGGGVSRMWSKAKAFGGEALAATLSADKLAENAAIAGVNKVAGGIESASSFVDQKAEQAKNFVGSKYEQARKFTMEKAGQLKQFALGKVELAKDVAAYGASKTVEGYKKVATGVENRYNAVKSYGESAIVAAQGKAAEFANGYRERVNKVRMDRLNAEIARLEQQEAEQIKKLAETREKKQNLIGKVALLQSLAA